MIFRKFFREITGSRILRDEVIYGMICRYYCEKIQKIELKKFVRLHLVIFIFNS